MSNLKWRFAPNRTTRCPTCEARPHHVCVSATGAATSPHKARVAAEQELAAALAESQTALRRYRKTRERLTA